MRILVFSPIELPYTIGARYTGLEKLAVQFAEQWHKLGHDVALLAHKDTDIPRGIEFLPCEGYVDHDRTIHAEQKAYQQYQYMFRTYDVIWDISHLHLIARLMSNMPTANVFSANPEYEARSGHQKAPYNLISWSRWGVGQIRKWYHQGAKYQETIMVDPEVFKPSHRKRNDRFLTIGRMSPEKGNLNAVRLCKKLGLKLDVCGGRGSEMFGGEALTDYEKEVMDNCDGDNIVFWGEVDEEQKLELMKSCKGLIYMTDHVEITSHKIQEAMMCGAPVIVPNHGGIPEIVTHGVDGYLCNDPAEYVMAIDKISTLTPSATREALIKKYSPVAVAQGYLSLFEKIKEGLRW